MCHQRCMHALQARWVSEEEARYVPTDLVSNFGSDSMDLDLNDLMVGFPLWAPVGSCDD